MSGKQHIKAGTNPLNIVKFFKFCITFFENLPLFLSRKILTLGRKHCYESLVGSSVHTNKFEPLW